MKKTKILFICFANMDRSPTAAHIYANYPDIETKSAGTASGAVVPVHSGLIEWADVILCMEDWQKLFIQTRYVDYLSGKEVGCLYISDNYEYWHPQLISMIKERMKPWLLKYGLNEMDI